MHQLFYLFLRSLVTDSLNLVFLNFVTLISKPLASILINRAISYDFISKLQIKTALSVKMISFKMLPRTNKKII